MDSDDDDDFTFKRPGTQAQPAAKTASQKTSQYGS